MWMLYALLMYIMVFFIRISALWDPKSRAWIAGRKNWKKKLHHFKDKRGPRVWFHVSSLGEFEQSRSVIEAIKKQRPDIQVFLSFFSPSGYIPRREYQFADVLYLPPDLPGNAAYFLDYVQPDVTVFVKYDLWPGFLKELHKRRIPAFLISAHWTADDRFSSWSAPLTRGYLKSFKKIFQQREFDKAFFAKQGFSNIQVSGDTRIDRSIDLADETGKIPSFLYNSFFDLVAGSTWPKDEEILIPVIRKLHLKAIIVPHDVSKANIIRLSTLIGSNSQLLSELGDAPFKNDILIVDSIGLLSVLYARGKLAYVGGGFGKGIHNILEPAAHGKPIVFGPKHDKFPEASDLIKAKAAFSVKNESSLQAILEELLNPAKTKEAGELSLKYLHEHSGASAIVTKSLLESIPYTVKE